jgi:hypothetical protein
MDSVEALWADFANPIVTADDYINFSVLTPALGQGEREPAELANRSSAQPRNATHRSTTVGTSATQSTAGAMRIEIHAF